MIGEGSAEEGPFVVVIDPYDGEPVKISTDLDGNLPLSTLQSTFPGATGLKYKETNTGMRRAVSYVDNGKRLCPPSGGWNTEFTIIGLVSRPSSSMGVFTNEQCKVLLDVVNERLSRPTSRPQTPVMDNIDQSGSPARPSSPWPEFAVGYLLETASDGCCVTVMATRAAITCAHCLNFDQKNSGSVVVKPCKGNPLKSFPNGQSTTVLKIAFIDTNYDFALLVSAIPLCQEPPYIDDAPFGETYILLGLSGQNRNFSKPGPGTSLILVNGPLSVKKGVVCSKTLDQYNKHSGDSGMNKGDSGGGLFSMCGNLIGMAVEYDRSPKNGIMLMHFLPMSYLLPVFQSQGYPIAMLNSFEEGYPEKQIFSPPEDRAH